MGESASNSGNKEDGGLNKYLPPSAINRAYALEAKELHKETQRGTFLLLHLPQPLEP